MADNRIIAVDEVHAGLRLPNYNDERTCWICYGTDEDDPRNDWRSPCRCRGSTKWAHESCLLRYIQERRLIDANNRVRCPLCLCSYRLIHAQPGLIYRIAEWMDNMIPTEAALLGTRINIAIYWSACSFGTFNAITILGIQGAVNTFRSSDPMILTMVLSMIPIGLVGFQLIEWENFLMHHILGVPRPVEQIRIVEEVQHNMIIAQFFESVIIFPTVSRILGRLLFGNRNSRIMSVAFGGVVYTVARGAFKMLKTYMLLRKLNRRRIMN